MLTIGYRGTPCTPMLRTRDDNIFAALFTLPWSISLIAATTGYAIFRYLVPLASANPHTETLARASFQAAPYIAGALALLASLSFARQTFRRRLLSTQARLDAIRAMDWQNFELLLAEGFRRLGYSIQEHGDRPSDAGIDIDMRKDGSRVIVQCKQWRTQEVGVATLRELYGVMTSEKAEGALVVTSGSFTLEAEAFAKDKPIGLIDGLALLDLVNSVQTAHQKRIAADAAPAPACPVCERPMITRKAPKDSTIGRVFWGCTQYPSCRGARPL